MNPASVYLIKSVVFECRSDILAVGAGVGSGGCCYICIDIDMDNNQSGEQELSLEVRFEQLVELTAELLQQLIRQQGTPCESIFNSASIPNIPLPDFLRRLHRFTQYSKECLIIAIIYIDRYNMGQPAFSLNSLNVHKVTLTAILVAAKFQDDFYYDNKAFEFAGGVNAVHLHQLELEIFEKLDYNLFVSDLEYQQLQNKLYEAYAPDEQH